MEITILDTGVHSATENMEIDQKLLAELDPDQLPILHIYKWQGPSATYGHFTDPSKLLNMQEVEGIDLAKRVTGGGMTFHFCDYAFSFLMPRNHPNFSLNTLENYRFINQFVYLSVAKIIEEKAELGYLEKDEGREENEALNFCMAKPSKYDVLYKGKKIGGAAQRKTALGYLHHGTISIALPDPEYLKAILKSEDSFSAINQNTYYLVSNHFEHEKLTYFREEIQENLIASILEY